MSCFWFECFDVEYYVIFFDVVLEEVLEGVDLVYFLGCLMVVCKCEVVLIECVVCGYLVGLGWCEYEWIGKVCGIELLIGMENVEKFVLFIFMFVMKVELGYDENILFVLMVERIGEEIVYELCEWMLDIY